MVRILVACALSYLLSGCATTGFQTVNGGSFISMYTESQAVSSNGEANKTGEACSMNILGIYSGGDSGIDAAKKAGGISKVSTVDVKVFTVRPFYGSVCTIVKGS